MQTGQRQYMTGTGYRKTLAYFLTQPLFIPHGKGRKYRKIISLESQMTINGQYPLSAVAFFMLLCRPVWLFDVGFQLSFCAVTAILLLQPRIYRWFPGVHSRIGHYLCSLMSVSIAAQIGTAPLVLLYFSRFSTHFLLTNLLVIPLVSFIMYTTVIMLLFPPCCTKIAGAGVSAVAFSGI